MLCAARTSGGHNRSSTLRIFCVQAGIASEVRGDVADTREGRLDPTRRSIGSAAVRLKCFRPPDGRRRCQDGRARLVARRARRTVFASVSSSFPGGGVARVMDWDLFPRKGSDSARLRKTVIRSRCSSQTSTSWRWSGCGSDTRKAAAVSDATAFHGPSDGNSTGTPTVLLESSSGCLHDIERTACGNKGLVYGTKRLTTYEGLN
jgi:hypothetical protein